MHLRLPSFQLPRIFGQKSRTKVDPLAQEPQAFVAYPFAGGATAERLPNDLELNDFATHQHGVLEPAVDTANRRNTEKQAFLSKLFPKTRGRAESTETPPQNGAVTFKDVDYVDVYKQGSKDLLKNLENAGMRIPRHLTMGLRTFAEDEHVKNNVTSKYNIRQIRDDDPALKKVGFLYRFSRANQEKKLITYKNIRQYACHTMMKDIKAVSALFGVAPNGKDVQLKATNVDELRRWFKAQFNVTLPKSVTKASKQVVEAALAKRPPDLKGAESELRRLLDLLVEKIPFGNEIKAFSEKLQQEQLDQTRYAKKNVRRFSLEDGSFCEKVSDTEFTLTRPHGTEAVRARFVKKDGESNFAVELYRLDADGNATAIPLGSENAWSRLQEHFDKTSVLAALFGDGSALHKTGFDALFGRVKANEMIEQKIADFINQPIKDVLDQKLKNCTVFHGTGFSYNGAHYGENLGIESRSVVMGLIHKKAMNGDLVVNGSCGFQQDLLWHTGGHIIAIQDITGKTFLDSEHGNDPYTVEEKPTWQSIKPDTATAGVYETPEGRRAPAADRRSSRDAPIPHAEPNSGETARTRWRPRDVAPLSIPMRTTYQEKNGDVVVETRPLLMTHRGLPVPASSGLTLHEAEDAEGNPIDLDAIADRSDLTRLVLKHELPEGTALADDEGNLVKDESGNPVRLLEKVVVQRSAENGVVRDVRRDAAGHLAFKGDDFEIASIERWIRMPLSDSAGVAKTDESGRVLCTYKKEVQNVRPNPEILRDRQFSSINCVHTQNGLAVPHVQLAPGVEIVSHSVKPNDAVFDRSFIPGASKANPNPHPVHVPKGTPQQALIVEAMEIQKGQRTIGRTTQHHVDMIREEGGRRMNPYYAGRYDHVPDERYRGHREGNVEAIETGNYVRNTNEMFRELNGVFKSFHDEVGLRKKQLSATIHALKDYEETARDSLILSAHSNPEALEGTLRPLREKLADAARGRRSARSAVATSEWLLELVDGAAYNLRPSSLNPGANERNEALFRRYREGPRKLIYDLFAHNDLDKAQCERELRQLLDQAPRIGISDEIKAEIASALEAWAAIQASGGSGGARPAPTPLPRNVKAVGAASSSSAASGEIALATRAPSEIEEADGRLEALTAAMQSAFDGGDPLRQIASIEYLVNAGLVDHWDDVQGTAAKVKALTRIIQAPEVTELQALLKSIRTDEAAIESMSRGLSSIGEMLASGREDPQRTRTDLQRHFRSYPGWSIAPGEKAGAAMDAPIAEYFHSVAAGTAAGTAALSAATGAFGPLLIAMGIEQGKNAQIALRRLKEVKKPYEDCLKQLHGQRADLETFGKTLQRSLAGNTEKEGRLAKTLADVGTQIQSKQTTLGNRLKVIDQQINDTIFSAWTGPLLSVDGAAVGAAAVASGLHAGGIAATIGGAAAAVGSGALTMLGAANLVKTAHEYQKVRKIDRDITRLNLGEDSNLRLNFNTFEQNKKRALQYQIGNWSVFTTASGLLTAAPFTGPAAPIVGAIAGTALAASTVTAFILPKREWRGRTMRAGENTTHVKDDFLATERRKNRLCSNLFNQLGMQQNILQKIVDRAIDGNNKFDAPPWKQFRYTFEKTRSLRWLYTDADRKILSNAIGKHPEQTRDLQLDLMLRSTDHEVNYMTFQVNERRGDVARHAASVARLKEFARGDASASSLLGAMEEGLRTMTAELGKEETRLQSLGDLRARLRDFSQYENKSWAPETQKKFDELRLRHMVAHDMLVDSMSRGEIRELVQKHEKEGAGVLAARFGDHTYEGKSRQVVGKKERMQNVELEYGDKTFDFLMSHIDRLDERFAHMMCYTIPDKLSYEANAVMNMYEEELKQRVKDAKAEASSGAA